MGNSYAMEAASNIRTCLYRSGYDISIPLSPKHVFSELSATPAADRRFFLTVKVCIFLDNMSSSYGSLIVGLTAVKILVLMT